MTIWEWIGVVLALLMLCGWCWLWVSGLRDEMERDAAFQKLMAEEKRRREIERPSRLAGTTQEERER
jgi:hypothetical protein